MKNKYLIILLFVAALLHGQKVKIVDPKKQDLRQKYVQAIRLQNQNQTEKALQIFEYLVEQMPQEKLFYSKYFDLLFETKKYDQLESILPQFVLDYPNNERAKIDLGKLYFLKDDTTKAVKTWNKYLKEANYSKLFTSHLFYTMVSLRLRDQAEDLLLKSRQINDDETLFAKDLGDLYYAAGQYKKSISEYLIYLEKDDKHFSYVSNMLLRYPQETAVFQPVDSLLQAKIQETNHINFHKLRTNYLILNKKFEKAGESIFQIEKASNYSGKHILDFSKNLMQVKEYKFAKKYFNKIIRNPHFKPITRDILLNLAKVEEKLVTHDTASTFLNHFFPGNYFFNTPFVFINDSQEQNLSKAFALYDSLANMKNGKKVSGRAEYSIANLRNNFLRDFDGAIEHYDRAEKKSRSVRFRHRCFNDKLLAIIATGNLDAAKKALTKRRTQFNRNFDQDYLMNKILLAFLSNNYEQILKLKPQVIKKLGVNHDIFNDYMELATFITQNYKDKSDDEQTDFDRFVQSEFLLRQSKLNESLEVLKYLIQKESPIADESAFRLTQIYLQLGYESEAENTAHNSIKKDSEYRVQTANMLANYYYYSKNMAKSKEWYQVILLDYPNSFYIETARNRLRKIRGDNI